MNEVITNIYSRRSVRSFQAGKSIDEELITEFLKCAMAAPSACKSDPWEFIVIDREAVKEELSKAFSNSQVVKNSNVLIVVCGNTDKAFLNSFEFVLQDCATATQNVLLAAKSLGIGSCWLSVHFNNERVESIRRSLEIPEYLTPVTCIALGYPVKDQSSFSRYDIQNVHRNKWSKDSHIKDKVSEIRIIKDGFVQSFYKGNNFEIVISKIEKNVWLNSHKHEEKQFGLSLVGKFEFQVENNSYLYSPGDAYHLESNIEHSAEALETFSALDFKYYDNETSTEIIRNNKYTTSENRESCIVKKYSVGLNDITSLNTKNSNVRYKMDCSRNKNYYIVSSHNTDLIINGINTVFSEMVIYHLQLNDSLEIESNVKDLIVLIIETEK